MLSTPAAIVIGLALAGAFVSVGVYMGLHSRPVSSDSAAIVPLASAVGTIAAAPPPSATATEGDLKAAQLAATADVERAFARMHAQLVRDCWEPSAARAPDPPKVVITFTLGYGPDGHPTTRSLRTSGTAVRADVSACVNREVTQPEITPLGVRTRVTVDLTLP